jgi:hypothetical protein
MDQGVNSNVKLGNAFSTLKLYCGSLLATAIGGLPQEGPRPRESAFGLEL